jgi:hypothetical protein
MPGGTWWCVTRVIHASLEVFPAILGNVDVGLPDAAGCLPKGVEEND